jgi:large-conductance mechanosensitive channel
MEQHGGFTLNIGDILFQLFSFVVVITALFIIIFLIFMRSNNQTKQSTELQAKLNALESKVDRLGRSTLTLVILRVGFH